MLNLQNTSYKNNTRTHRSQYFQNVLCLYFSYDSRQSVVPIEQNQANSILERNEYNIYHTNTIPSRPPSPADLWSDKDAFGDRAHFRVSTWPAVLKVTGVQRYDAGTYTCRVDFRQAPTVYHHVTLDVIGRLINFMTWLPFIYKLSLPFFFIPTYQREKMLDNIFLGGFLQRRIFRKQFLALDFPFHFYRLANE